MTSPQILVTNDDGIDSIGLHALARAMRPLGEVTIVAPDSEYSGAGAAIGPIWDHAPDVHEANVEGIDTAWTVAGPPALCVLYARLGAFGFEPDLIVSGVNPGANVGRAVYNSGTIGATISGRVGGISGVAVSQAIPGSAEGQAWGDVIASMHFNSASQVAAAVVEGLLANPLAEPGLLNVNVPNLPLEEIQGWGWAEVATSPWRSLSKITLAPKPGHVGSFNATYETSGEAAQEEGSDSYLIQQDKVSVSWLSTLHAVEQSTPWADDALTQVLA